MGQDGGRRVTRDYCFDIHLSLKNVYDDMTWMTDGKLGIESLLSLLSASELERDCRGVCAGVLGRLLTDCCPPRYSSCW